MRKKGKKNTPIHLPQNLKDQISESYANVGDEDGHYRIAKPTNASHFTQNRRLERKKKKLEKKNKKKLSHEFKMSKHTGVKTRDPEIPNDQVEKKRKLSSIQSEDPYKQSVKKIKVEKNSIEEAPKNKTPQKQQKQLSKDDRNANFMKLLQTDGLIPRNKGEKVVYPEDSEIEFYTKMLKKTAKKKDSFLENILKPTNKDSSDVSDDEEGEEGDYEEELFGSEEDDDDEKDDFLNQNSEEEDDDEEQYLSEDDSYQSEEEGDNKKSRSKDTKTSDKKGNKEEKSATQERVSKYIPPHLRQKQVGQNKNSGEITKTVRGILNRASEANLSLVITQIQELFDSHPRNDVNTLLAEIMIEHISSEGNITNVLPVYAAIIAIIHYHAGNDVTGFTITKWVKEFNDAYDQDNMNISENCVSFISYLYVYRTIHCAIIYDLIRKFIASFQEVDVVALLSLLKISGQQLKTDDPSSLKDIIITLQEQQSKYKSEKQNSSNNLGIRVQYMLDMIYDLKNNKKRIYKKNTSGFEQLLPLVETARKGSTSEQLKISWENLVSESEKPEKKKWWIRGESLIEPHLDQQLMQEAASNAKLYNLAKKQGMNTELRRTIFCIILSSEDYLDAFEKLMRLGLKGSEEREIVYVLLRCCSNEISFNQFYSVLSQKFCTYSYNFKFTFQYAFWDQFKILDEKKTSAVSNLAQLLAELVGSSAMSLSVLKPVDFVSLSPISAFFFRIFFVCLICDYDEEAVQTIFERITTHSSLYNLRENIILFFSTKVTVVLNRDPKVFSKRVKNILHLLKTAPLPLQ